MRLEFKNPHEILVAWVQNLLTSIAGRWGEDAVLDSILEQSRAHNPRHGITGRGCAQGRLGRGQAAIRKHGRQMAAQEVTDQSGRL